MTQNSVIPPSLLSVAEMLDAPAQDYMSGGQRAFFRARLSSDRDALLRAAKATTDQLQQGAPTADPSDRASLEEDYTVELRVRDRERKLLHKIDEALARIELGTYGWCDETGEAIGIARLIARPTATLTVAAQQRREHRKRFAG